MKFQITYKATEEVAKFRSTQWRDFDVEVWEISLFVSTYNSPESDFEFMVDGQVVSLALAEKAAIFARKQWEAKRAETKKPVRISVGSTCLPNTYRTVWVNK
jgi:hypothetical protein